LGRATRMSGSSPTTVLPMQRRRSATPLRASSSSAIVLGHILGIHWGLVELAEFRGHLQTLERRSLRCRRVIPLYPPELRRSLVELVLGQAEPVSGWIGQSNLAHRGKLPQSEFVRGKISFGLEPDRGAASPIAA
jgi:hypothetical protein